MSQLNLFDLRQHLDRENVLICFNGPLSQNIIEDMAETIRQYIAAIDATRRGQLKDIFSVFVEQTQNIRNYVREVASTQQERHLLSASVIVIACDHDSYLVAAGNPVRYADVKPLGEHIAALNATDAAGLKRRYKEALRAPRPDGENRGAGLGLIDMARRARGPLAWDSVPLDDQHAFFSVRVTV
jgi:hypothetical protein